MKKAAVVFILCLALVLGTATAGGLALSQSREQVEVTAVTLKGDPAAAEGFTAYQSAHYDHRLLWDLAIPLAAPEETSAEFSLFMSQDELIQRNWKSMGLQLDIPHSIGQSAFPEKDPLDETTADAYRRPLLPLYREVASRTAPGERRTETLTLADYMDYYPITLGYDMGVALTEHPAWESFYKSNLLSDFFRFPVHPEEQWDFTVEKDMDGKILELSNMAPMPHISIDLLSVLSENEAFLAIGPDSQRLPSLAEIPGGNGIYHLRMEQDSATFTNVFPLPLDAMILTLDRSADGNDLILTYCLGEDYICLVLDAGAMAVKQSFPIPAGPPGEDMVYTQEYDGTPISYPIMTWQVEHAILGENFLLLYGGVTFHLYSLKNETYSYEFSGPLQDLISYYPNDDLCGAWNGETLALGTVPGSTLYASGLTVAVFEEGELLYQGVYQTSLEDLPTDLDPTQNSETYTNYRQDQSVEILSGKALRIDWMG